jgi:inward rectifier potassium channel
VANIRAFNTIGGCDRVRECLRCCRCREGCFPGLEAMTCCELWAFCVCKASCQKERDWETFRNTGGNKRHDVEVVGLPSSRCKALRRSPCCSCWHCSYWHLLNMQRRLFSFQVFLVYTLLILSMALPVMILNVASSTNLVQDVDPNTGKIALDNTTLDTALAPTFGNAFFFAHQTISSIGYGVLSPRSDLSNFLVAWFGFFGFILLEMSSGLIWSKFTKTSGALVASSEHAVVTKFHGQRALMFRMVGLWRYRPITTARIQAMAYLPWYDKKTGEMRGIRGHALKFVRAFNPLFVLPATFIHIMDDEDSPLHQMSQADFLKKNSMDNPLWFSVIFEGQDSCLGQSVSMEHVYLHDKVLWGHRHVDMLEFDADRKQVRVNMLNFHKTVPLDKEEFEMITLGTAGAEKEIEKMAARSEKKAVEVEQRGEDTAGVRVRVL